MVIFLETAELRAKNRVATTMDFWRKNADQVIQSNDFDLLQGQGEISKKKMEQFDSRRKAYDAKLADCQDEEELKQLEQRIKNLQSKNK